MLLLALPALVAPVGALPLLDLGRDRDLMEVLRVCKLPLLLLPATLAAFWISWPGMAQVVPRHCT